MYCTICGAKIAAGAKFCNQCGIPTTGKTPPGRISRNPGTRKRVLKWGGIGCGGLLGLFIILVVIAELSSSSSEDSRASNGSSRAGVSPNKFPTLALPTPTPTPGLSTTPTKGSIETDREVLIILYETTGGTRWKNHWNWMTDAPLESWDGVTTDNNGRVTELDLFDNNLVGSIPSELGNLSNLVYLDLSDNKLSGRIPLALSNLSSLTYLDVANNKLTARLPAFDSMEHLEVLNFDGNHGLCAPQIVAQSWLRNIERTNGSVCPTPTPAPTRAPTPTLTPTPIPSANTTNTSDRAALVALYSATRGWAWTKHPNWLTDEPVENWKGVTTDSNGRVTELYLAGNNLEGRIPPELGNLSELTYLNLSDNSLWPPIPRELGSLPNLVYLNLSGNRLRAPIPPEIGNLSILEHLDLSNNDQEGPIPMELGNLSNLSYLDLSTYTRVTRGDNMTGPIPTNLAKLSNLTHLNLAGNNLTGSIPAELGFLSNLIYLDLADNEFSGSIPPELGRLSRLTHLDLGHLPWNVLTNTSLTGPVPPELGNLINLRFLNLNFQNLSGELPQSLTKLTNLELFLFDSIFSTNKLRWTRKFVQVAK